MRLAGLGRNGDAAGQGTEPEGDTAATQKGAVATDRAPSTCRNLPSSPPYRCRLRAADMSRSASRFMVRSSSVWRLS